MYHTYEEVCAKIDPKRVARAKKRAQKIKESLLLKELRQARQMSQEQLAEVLHIKQASVSKLERRTDMYISTLRDFLRAMGGELEIRAIFPNAVFRIDQFHQIGEHQ